MNCSLTVCVASGVRRVRVVACLALVAACQPAVNGTDAAGNAAAPAAGEAAAYVVPPHYAGTPGPTQPVAFSHAVHAGTLAQPCVLCHVGADGAGAADPRTANGAHMSLPELSVCMDCHSSIATDKESVKKLAGLHASGQPVSWVRAYRVLPGVSWSHKPHIDAGLACEGCHGDVTALEVMNVRTAVTAMASCIGCHRSGQASPECVTCHAWPRPEDI